MFMYRAYGLTFASDLPLTPLERAQGTGPAVRIAFASLNELRRSILASEQGFLRRPGETGLHWEDIGTFLVRNGREILVDPSPDAEDGDLEIALLGPALAALLDQRGDLLLHASGVAVAGEALLFLGGSGWGKSSMASALQARGHPVVVDDLAVVRFARSGARLVRGIPQVKLWPDAARAVGLTPEALPTIGKGYEKRRSTPPGGFTAHPDVPLGRIYVLASGAEPAVRRLSAVDALLHLTVHSYGIRWFLRDADVSRLLERASLARSVPVSLLIRPAGIELLPRLVRLVEDDALPRVVDPVGAVHVR
jgi:hypothetical protein